MIRIFPSLNFDWCCFHLYLLPIVFVFRLFISAWKTLLHVFLGFISLPVNSDTPNNILRQYSFQNHDIDLYFSDGQNVKSYYVANLKKGGSNLYNYRVDSKNYYTNWKLHAIPEYLSSLIIHTFKRHMRMRIRG